MTIMCRIPIKLKRGSVGVARFGQEAGGYPTSFMCPGSEDKTKAEVHKTSFGLDIRFNNVTL